MVYKIGLALMAGFVSTMSMAEMATNQPDSDHAQAQATVTMPLEELLTLAPEDVPEEVIVTNLIGADSSNLPSIHTAAYILDTLPANWENTGRGRLSVSEDYSNAGVRSIRWDWQAGDILRIKDLNMLSEHGRGGNATVNPGFYLAGLLAEELPEGTEFNFYLRRPFRESHWDPALTRNAVIKMRQYAHATPGSWFSLTDTHRDRERPVPEGWPATRFLSDVVNVDVYDQFPEDYPEGVPEPEMNELIIQAPTNVASGTIYFDRLLVGASQFIEGTREEMVIRSAYSGPHSSTQITRGYQEVPQQFLDLVPDELNPEQQAFLDGLRAANFPETAHLTPGTEAYADIERQAQAELDRLCLQRPDGSYVVRPEINFSGNRVYFRGDLFMHRKHYPHIPQTLSNGEVVDLQVTIAGKDWGRACNFFLACPDSPITRAFFVAMMDWWRYQVISPPEIGPPPNKYSLGPYLGMCERLFPVLAERPELVEYYEYVGNLVIAVGGVREWATYIVKTDPYHGLEFPHADAVFRSILFEPNDELAFAMLEHYRNNWNMLYSISTPGRTGMIKPDYTYFHHGIASYWGNYSGYMRLGERYMNNLLAFEPRIHRTLANHTTRYVFGGPIVALMGEQQNSYWGLIGWKRQFDSDPDRAAGLTSPPLITEPETVGVETIERYPTDQVFRYFYHMDWEEVPAARKVFRSLLGMYAYDAPETLDNLYAAYPRLEPLGLQTDMHMSFNYTGASGYTHRMSSVFAGSITDDVFVRAANDNYSWARRYGILMPYSTRRAGYHILGADINGYDWTKVPGTTIPEIDIEGSDPSHDPSLQIGVDNSSTVGNGSLTFNETDEYLGRYGNYSIRILPVDDAARWQAFYVTNFEALKSYHFCGDRVVALGSNIRADTNRPMQTVLFQEMTDMIPWQRKDHRRWAPAEPTVNLNGASTSEDMEVSISLDRPNYIISPYGHAYLLPAGQEGTLDIEWATREFVYRREPHNTQPGRGVIARILQISGRPSSYHYCLLLNSDGKPPEELDAYAQQRLAQPGYDVLRQDELAHAVRFGGIEGENDLYSYVVYTADAELDLPHVESVNRPVSIMMQQDANGDYIVSVVDTQVNYDAANGIQGRDRHTVNTRTVTVTFGRPITLLAARSGLPESNPPLNASVQNGRVLTFDTRDGISDTFTVRFE